MDKLKVWPYFNTVRYAKLDEGAFPPTRKHFVDAGIDFYALEPVLIAPHTWKVVRTGISIEVPQGYFGLMKPKGSSSFLVGAGVVDAEYQGEILLKVFNVTLDRISFLPGQAIGQMVFIPIVVPKLEEVSKEELLKIETSRGESGGIHSDRS